MYDDWFYLNNLDKLQNQNTIDRLALIGLIKVGMTFKDGKVIQTLTLTNKGKQCLEEIEILKQLKEN